MAFTTIEIFALIFAVVAAIKIFAILIKPSCWYKVVKTVWKAPFLTGLICLVLAAIVFYCIYYVAGISLTTIFAVMLFTGLLAGVSIAVYAKEVVGLAKKLLNPKLLVKAWIPLLIWIALIVWALYILLA